MSRKIQQIDREEAKRRKREKVIIFLTAVGVILLTLLETYLSRRNEVIPVSNDVFIFGLVNINILLILLLIFLIVRNAVKIIFERRYGVIGSKLRTKLVVAFVTLSLVPSVVLFIFSVNFLSYSIDNWFNVRIGEALGRTLEVAQLYYGQTAEQARYYARQISSDITENRLYEKERGIFLNPLIKQRQASSNLGLIEIYFDNKKEKLIFADPAHPDLPPLDLTPRIHEEIFSGREGSKVRSVPEGEVVSGLYPIYSNLSSKDVIGVVVVSHFISKELVDKMAIISKSSEQYRQLNLLKAPIKYSYIVTLLIVTLLIIFSATWFGMFLAKGITVPIQDLAEATKRIARGDLDHNIDIDAADEIGVLVDSFNLMTRDLKKSTEELSDVNADLERRRIYMETVLRDVSAGVISVDGGGVITTINRAAESLLGINAGNILGRRYAEVLSGEHLSLVDELMEEIRAKGSIEKHIELMLDGRVVTLLITITNVKDDTGNDMGVVAVFEDMTQLQKAERAAAWREVARRMAHEVKNPLTPIQLSAQRLQKKYGDLLGEGDTVFYECTKTIISQVELLKGLVNEFSRYARMPTTNLSPNNINGVIAGAVSLFQDAHKDIAFEYLPGNDLPVLNLDSEQIQRVMINLLDNAVAAVKPGEGRVEVRTTFDRPAKKVVVEVADNGSGVPASYKPKMFEPYFSTKRTGTGLGLAIVSSIISDHHGQVGVSDNEPVGTIISFELPVPEAT
ncbi:MAG: ATP-binding protein [Smithellaceae bacterium]|nr:ATP-binding protein [Smithellaceae bacterium]